MPADLFVPDEQTLRQFLLGRLNAADSQRVEAYLHAHPEEAKALYARFGGPGGGTCVDEGQSAGIQTGIEPVDRR